MKPTIIDNVISSGYQDCVENIFDINFSWYFTPRISDDVNTDPNTGFSSIILKTRLHIQIIMESCYPYFLRLLISIKEE